jgi:hypothetical protein
MTRASGTICPPVGWHRIAAIIMFGPLGLGAFQTLAQSSTFGPLVETGQLLVAGREVPYRIRNLPVSSFPDLPAPVSEVLTARGCLIPQSYEAHRPENVVHASLESPGSSDWAVLCSVQGKVSLLVFFAGTSSQQPAVLAEVSEKERLQPHDLSGELGFNWGIDPASPKRIHEAQVSMAHRPPAPDHDSLADSIIDGKTVYHFYRNGAWETIHVE